ncbi:MAG: undecaprenyl-diphosphate phosphatase, partial [Chloroflexi bacterium]|nr:undecaprenyl-diphosphate phosphatase [Chloroflexota bacterium]
MEILQAVFLGVVQGLTEFLPVSGTGHLLLAQWFLGISPDQFGLAFDASLHLGTLVALLAVFGRNVLSIAAGVLGALVKGEFRAPAAAQGLALVVG